MSEAVEHKIPVLHKASLRCASLWSDILKMQVTNQIKTVYNFKNTCMKCFNDIEFPLLGDFSYGEIIFQTEDGQDYYVAELINNETFNFIAKHLQEDQALLQKKADPQKVLMFAADKPHGKDFSVDYPICPICKSKQNHYSDNIRTNTRELPFVTWNGFQQLNESDKVEQIRKAVQTLT
jgi:hypothetical protein